MLLRPRSVSGWLSCVAQSDGSLRLALVEPAERPVLRWLHSEPAHASAAATLHRARRAAPRAGQLVSVLERGQYQLLQTEAPEMPADEWRDALRWRLKDQLEFTVDGASIDLLQMPAQAGPRNARTLIVAAASGSVRQQLQRTAEDAGASWAAVDIAETALRNLSGLLATAGRGHALLHLGDSHATLVVTVAGHLLLSRQIEVARAQLASTDEYQRNQAMERAGLELQRTLDGFDRVFSQVGLERLDVLPCAGAEPFADFARELVYAPVKVADMAAKLDLAALPADADLSGHWVAIGAALRQASPAADGSTPHDLNLDPPTQRPEQARWRASQGLWTAAGALTAAWLLATGLDAWAQRREVQATALAASLPAQRAQLEARDPGGADAITRLAAERQRLQDLEADQRRLRAEIDAHLQRASSGYTDYFAALSRQSQATVWITGFSVAGSSGAIEIQGRMSDAAQLPGYLQRLNQETAFKGRQFARLQLAPADNLTEFTLGGMATDAGGVR